MQYCRKKFGLLLWLVVITFLPLTTALSLARTVPPFVNHEGYVVLLADLHYPLFDAQVKTSFDIVISLKPLAVFLLGDLTEIGHDSEFADLQKLLSKLKDKGINFHCLLGNHDTRWASTLRKTVWFGFELYESFSVQVDGIQFIGLDSSMFFEHFGHFGKTQLTWLKDQLTGLDNRSREVVLLAHHPIEFTDDGWKIPQLVNGFNVPFLVVGHGHTFKTEGPVNGMYQLMIGACKDGLLTVLSWDKEHFYVWRTKSGRDYELYLKVPRVLEKRLDQNQSAPLRIPTHDAEKPYENNSLKVLWKSSMKSSIFSEPVLCQGKFIVADYAGNVQAISFEGQIVWEQKVGPVVANLGLKENFIIVGDLLGDLTILDAEDGNIVRYITLPGPIYAVTPGSNSVAVGVGSYFYQLSWPELEIVKKISTSGAIQRPALFTDGKYYQTSWGGGINIVDEKEGKIGRIDVGTSYYTAAPCIPVVFGNTIIVTNTVGKIQAFNPERGKPVWEVNVDGVGYSKIALCESYGYVSTINGDILKLDLGTGKVVTKLSMGRSIYDSSPVLLGSSALVVCSTDGYVIVLQETEGRTIKHEIRVTSSYILNRAITIGSNIFVSCVDGTVALIHFLEARSQ